MNFRKRFNYYLLLLLLPVSFVLHGVNENFGLIDATVSVQLLLIYLAITLVVGIVSYFILRSGTKAFFFSFIFLLVYFLFGVFKDFTRDISFLRTVTRYSVLLPIIGISLVLLMVYLKRKNMHADRPAKLMGMFLLINIMFETGWFLYNLVTKENQKQDFGDHHHLQLNEYRPNNVLSRPDVFWFVFDEYAASSTLKKVWQFTNPLDTLLRKRQFLVIDSARSNYNFTHYSLSSTLDLAYLKRLQHHSVVTLRDLARGSNAIYDNNVLQVFSRTGYAINNYTIFHLKDQASRGMLSFREVPRSLIDFQTLGGRLHHDIGWNLPTLFTSNKRKADSLMVNRFLKDLDTAYDGLINRSIHGIEEGALKQGPSAFLFHFMIPHEPFMYNANGTIAHENGFSIAAEHYIEHLKYTNAVITRLVDSILANYRERDIVIILQGDHGFKFQEDDALYDTESCAIFYAVYCSDGNYSPWYNTMSSVNGFRVLFNKYFNTRFTMLPDTSYVLYYR